MLADGHVTVRADAAQSLVDGNAALELDLLELWVRRVATALGLLVLLLPLVRLWRTRHALRGRASGSYGFLTRWPAVFLLAIAFVSTGILLWKPLPIAPTMPLRLLLLLAGSLGYFLGVVLYLWGFRALGTMFGVSTGLAAQLYDGHQLVDTGPYGLVRHPMYLGVILTAIGALLIFRTWAMALFAPAAAAVVVRARREEELLAKEFGDAWTEYCTRVAAWIPRLRSERYHSD